jgi:hypothetical protein
MSKGEGSVAGFDNEEEGLQFSDWGTFGNTRGACWWRGASSGLQLAQCYTTRNGAFGEVG